MITEDYVSFETAKLLKEKGFNEKCRGGYHSEFDDNDNSVIMLEEWMAQLYNNDFEDETFLCSAPTHQMAMKWLREVHNIVCNIDIESRNFYYYSIFIIRSSIEAQYQLTSQKPYFETYEEACEAAIKYCLENLI